MKVPRIYENLDNYIKPNKVLVLFGPRQVGKTTLISDYLKNTKLKTKSESGDNLSTRQILSSQEINILSEYVAGYDLLFIDEAQKIPNIGVSLKILVDQVKDIKIIATGSSSFELAGQIGEPLTGRKTTLTLYPISLLELKEMHNSMELKNKLNEYLVFGGYPEVITAGNNNEKIKILEELTHSYLLKDILELERIKSSKTLLDLLRLLAFQVGNEVSLSELGKQLGIDYKTVQRYLDLFEKAFVIYNLRAYSGNLRNEITTKSKYYFYDNGIRNTIISNFNSIEQRNDVGALWENFIFYERLKKRSYTNIYSNMYFWRTTSGKEIDLIEEREGKLFGYEFKWGNRKIKAPKIFTENYSNATYKIIDKENYYEFVL